MWLLADENIPLETVRALRSAGHDVYSATESASGASDLTLLERAIDEERLIVTFDRDFGELAVRSSRRLQAGLLLLRFIPSGAAEVSELLINLLARGDLGASVQESLRRPCNAMPVAVNLNQVAGMARRRREVSTSVCFSGGTRADHEAGLHALASTLGALCTNWSDMAYRILPRALLALLAVCTVRAAIASRELRAQALPSIWVSAGAGSGASVGNDQYRGSLIYTAHVSMGVGLGGKFGLEGSFQRTDGFGEGDYACVGGRPCPHNFDVWSGMGTIVLGLGSNPEGHRLRLGFGAGAYRVARDSVYNSLPEVTALGLHATVAATLHRWSRVSLDLSLGAAVLPDVNDDSLWLIPLQLGLRFPTR